MGGDWNCCTDFTLDRTGEEPHSVLLSCLMYLEKLIWLMCGG